MCGISASPYVGQTRKVSKSDILPSVDGVEGRFWDVARVGTWSIYALNFHPIEPNSGSLLMKQSRLRQNSTTDNILKKLSSKSVHGFYKI